MSEDFNLVDAIKKDNREASRLRASHDRLLAAARVALIVIDNELRGDVMQPDEDNCFIELQAAIAAAEELKP